MRVMSPSAFFRINHRLRFISAGKFLHRIHGIEAQQGGELHFIAIFTDEQFRAVITLDVSRGDAWKDFGAQHFFICLRICAFRPSVPDPRNHESLRCQAATRAHCSPRFD
jgi:hypothetical protein